VNETYERERIRARFAAARAYSELLADGWSRRQQAGVSEVIPVALDDSIEFAMSTVDRVGVATVAVLNDGGQLELFSMSTVEDVQSHCESQVVRPGTNFHMLLALLRELPGEHFLTYVRHGERTATLKRSPELPGPDLVSADR